jgi:hypothetical protein
MRMLRITGVAAAVIATLPFLAGPAHADVAGVTGIVRGPDDVPIKDACLTVYSAASETTVADPFCSDADGRYTITGLPAASYKVKVAATGYRTVWWIRGPDYLNADFTWISDSSLAEHDVTLGVGSGTVTGRITDQAGAAADATVQLHSADDTYQPIEYTWDLGDGRYSFENVPPGDYQISIHDNFHGTQWIPGKETRDDAPVFTVADGQTVTADDQWLPLGSVQVQVGDADTGKPIAAPCAYVRSSPNPVQACGTKGVVNLADVPPGDWDLDVSAGASYFTPAQPLQITVQRGKTTKVITTLEPGAAVKTRVVDAATGAPLANICVHVVDAKWSAQSAHMGQFCSGPEGTLEIGPFDDAWTTNLYAWQYRNPWEPPSTLYGDQWVGANGGTGDQREALKVKFVPKKTKTIATIRMDPPATVTGIISDATTGAPISGVCTYPYAFHPGQGAIFGKNCSNATGRYTIDDVGPYNWPVEFAPNTNSGYAWQWSGDVADRFAATYTPLTAGQSATLNAKLIKGAELDGYVSVNGSAADNVFVAAYNSKTRDYAGPTWDYTTADGQFQLTGYRTQGLWIEYYPAGKDCWYGDTTDAATSVKVTVGQPASVSMETSTNCAPQPGTTATTTPAVKRGPTALLGAQQER